ncbi:MAG: class I SAM-dependent methyltransferase [Gammaproteobacteria bacterium]|nr:class I SAM-dependent methyltransferase [Gammaproteobacteria bacterium]
MAIATLPDAKKAIQALTETVWIFAVLTALAETSGLHALLKGADLAVLTDLTQIPTTILQEALALLSEKGFVSIQGDKYQLAPSLLSVAEQDGLDKIIAQLQITFGITREFVTSARNRSLRLGWHYTDESILQAQGTYSEYIVTDCIPLDPKLHHLLSQPQSVLLDVGAGVGKITLLLCKTYPSLRVVAIEPADKPYALAQTNIQQSTFHDRIELRKIFIEELDDQNVFDVIWFPHVFFSDETVKTGLKTAIRALKPGGILLTTALSRDKPPARMRQLLNSLHSNVRLTDDIKHYLDEAGFHSIQVFSTPSDYSVITATKPE